jgi:hypothetical protein
MADLFFVKTNLYGVGTVALISLEIVLSTFALLTAVTT